MAKVVVLKILTMTDAKTRIKAFKVAADIHGVDSINSDLNDQKLTVIGEINVEALAKKMKKVGKVEIVSVEEVKEPEKKEEEKKEENKDEKKEEKKEEKK